MSAEENTACGVDIHALSEELIIELITTLIVQELRDDKLAKFHLELNFEKCILKRVTDLKSVCTKWNSALSNSPKFLKGNILHKLRCAGVRPLLVQYKLFNDITVRMAKLRDKIYVILSENGLTLQTYGDNFQLEASISFPSIENFWTCIVCHDSLYVLAVKGIWKIMPKDMKKTLWLDASSLDKNILLTRLSVSKDRNLLIFHGGPKERTVKIYGPNADILRSFQVLSSLSSVDYVVNVAEKRNGNIVCYVHHKYITEVSGDKNLSKIQRNQRNFFSSSTWRLLLDSDDQIIEFEVHSQRLLVIDSNFRECPAVLQAIPNLPNNAHLDDTDSSEHDETDLADILYDED